MSFIMRAKRGEPKAFYQVLSKTILKKSIRWEQMTKWHVYLLNTRYFFNRVEVGFYIHTQARFKSNPFIFTTKSRTSDFNEFCINCKNRPLVTTVLSIGISAKVFHHSNIPKIISALVPIWYPFDFGTL